MEQVTLFTITGCIDCYKMKQHLKERNIPFVEVNLMEQPERLKDLIKVAGECQVPFLVKGEEALFLEDLN
ncbi:glutaredoxin family protein [Anaerobacillus sp. 1_MG-2023]|uniref:glutaredoxin family protein n=1 Tax=Anaerobacillus sp. 1_MG-2023 TaxID=3062655 RepID=UPI0026E31A10|nr:glutaredoxin family protein [Anaerobacillus sp. 1_MG-2023]MDO6655866.1 glutaredoxin family protein [Anaerobacillus sp. 1_MG-2023]